MFWRSGGVPNLGEAMKTFPGMKFSYVFDPKFLARSTRLQIREKIREIFDASEGNLHRFVLAMADVEHGTPNENIAEMGGMLPGRFPSSCQTHPRLPHGARRQGRWFFIGEAEIVPGGPFPQRQDPRPIHYV
jgi:hypothetical protein